MATKFVSDPNQEIISRVEAIARGLKTYFTGVACKNGHISLRQVSNWTCIQCSNTQRNDRRAADPEVAREKERARRAADPDHWREYERERRLSARRAR